jgi:26S proteasome regulatory subunit N9
VASAGRLPADAVEAALIRAMSLGLLKGRIDEVDALVHVSYVKPRVLDRAQIGALKERVDAWRAKAHTTLLFMEDRTSGIFA